MKDTTLGATWRQLHDLGFAATSAAYPDRKCTRYAQSNNRPDGFLALADHPGAILTHPTRANGCDLSDAPKRRVVALVVTSYLLADPKQAKAVMEVLSEYGLTSGPVRIDTSGHCYPLQWNGPAIFDGEQAARLAHDDDFPSVYLENAIEPSRYVQRTDEWSRAHNEPAEPVGSHVIPLAGDWKNGSLLDTPRWKLPELLKANVNEIISACERARWGSRPLARAKEAAA